MKMWIDVAEGGGFVIKLSSPDFIYYVSSEFKRIN